MRPKAIKLLCPFCNQRRVILRSKLSNCGSYVDHNFMCKGCHKSWVIEGVD